jgi:hypothetical protein
MDDKHIVDKWSLIHFLSGIIMFYCIMYIFSISQKNESKYSTGTCVVLTVIIHQLWEWYENSTYGIKMVRKLGWPDYNGDSTNNTIGDTFFFTIGCLVGILISFIVQ